VEKPSMSANMMVIVSVVMCWLACILPAIGPGPPGDPSFNPVGRRPLPHGSKGWQILRRQREGPRPGRLGSSLSRPTGSEGVWIGRTRRMGTSHPSKWIADMSDYPPTKQRVSLHTGHCRMWHVENANVNVNGDCVA